MRCGNCKHLLDPLSCSPKEPSLSFGGSIFLIVDNVFVMRPMHGLRRVPGVDPPIVRNTQRCRGISSQLLLYTLHYSKAIPFRGFSFVCCWGTTAYSQSRPWPIVLLIYLSCCKERSLSKLYLASQSCKHLPDLFGFCLKCPTVNVNGRKRSSGKENTSNSDT